jgi:hypothetical protein
MSAWDELGFLSQSLAFQRICVLLELPPPHAQAVKLLLQCCPMRSTKIKVHACHGQIRALTSRFVFKLLLVCAW